MAYEVFDHAQPREPLAHIYYGHSPVREKGPPPTVLRLNGWFLLGSILVCGRVASPIDE